ncbi:rhodanese-like domain-containing protein [Salirhabdus salicampi]|uniref:rhodanese-like domain-containing protein n=1 Tax=Salirhabdus salicampi TaxID=476102 RepID=UPI0020C42F5F|nr:rhodanese-like domain-containing protein [Salirhabdus salicampi]MCP8617680.1 rhodanese-like domain-containing protein [Salirhabdus salicampi]
MPVKGVSHITSKEAKDKKVQFVDVRTQGEYRSNHRKPFRNIPLHTLKNRLGELQKDKEVVVICQSGVRSMKAAKILKKHGFKHITNVKGGMSSWV